MGWPNLNMHHNWPMHDGPCNVCMYSFLCSRTDDLQVDGFQVLHDGPIISSISSAIPAIEALKPKKISLGCGVL
jgi:hypothetical protein